MLIKMKLDSASQDCKYLKNGKLYAVYAVIFDTVTQFLVYEPEAFSFPFFVSLDSIDLVENSLSKEMRYSPALPRTESRSSRPQIIGFPEIVENRLFYQNLVDGEEDARRVWEKLLRD